MTNIISDNGIEAIKKCVDTLIDWAGIGGSGLDGFWFGYEALKDETNIPIKELKLILKLLKSLKIVTYEPCYDGDGKLHGTGYFLREKTWLDIKKLLEVLK